MDSAKPHPDPPPDLSERVLPIYEGNPSLFRSHRIDLNPIYFGDSPKYRFDSPTGAFKVLYAGFDPECAFVETFGWTTGNRILTTTHLAKRALAELRPAKALRLVDLFSSGGLTRIGADGALTCASDYRLSRKWSQALYAHPETADGIMYPARHDPTRKAAAIFDRAPKLILVEDESFLCNGDKRKKLAEMLRIYGFKLIESRYEPHRKPPAKVTEQHDLF